MLEQVIAARDSKNHFGQLLDTAQRVPVLISKKGRPIAVVISLVEYENLTTGIAKSHKLTDFTDWLGYAKTAPLNPKQKFHSDDDLWQDD